MKNFLVLIGLGSTFGLSLLLALTFFWAVAQGGQVTVYVNRLGEMKAEIVLIPVVLILGGWATWEAWRKELK